MEMPVRCHECGGDMFPEAITYVARVGDEAVIFRNVPAEVCGQCGDRVFTSAVVAEIKRLLDERPFPTRTVTVPVYELVEGRYEAPSETPVGDRR